MADTLYFSRDTKVYLQMTTAQGGADTVWEIPILDGFSFSQATNTSEITLSEAVLQAGTSTVVGKSRRSRQMFTDSYAPAEWSFSTYVRPFLAVNGVTGGWEASGSDNTHHSVEEALWANFASNPVFTPSSGSTEATWKAIDPHTTGLTADHTVVSGGSKASIINFAASEVAELGTFDLHFELGDENASATKANYKIADCVVNEVTIDFDIDGIATLNWSGFGRIITDDSVVTATITEKVDSDTNMIRNRLTTLEITDGSTAYDITLTGGNITFTNNITFLTPETLGVINQPLGHVTGTRSITGNFTAYLNKENDSTAELFETIIENTSGTGSITNSHNIRFNIGGTPSGSFDATASNYPTGGQVFPSVVISLPKCHLEVPVHQIDDVISLETSFHALPADIDPAQTETHYEALIIYSFKSQ